MTKFQVGDSVIYAGSLMEIHGHEFTVSRISFSGDGAERCSLTDYADHRMMFGIRAESLLAVEDAIQCDDCRHWFEYGGSQANCHGYVFCPECIGANPCHPSCFEDD